MATLSAAFTRVALAALGAGAWCFVVAQVVHSVALLAVVWRLAPMRPRFALRKASMLELLRAGLPSSLSTAVMQWARNLDYVFVATWLGLHALGLYRVAFDLAMEPVVAMGDVVAKSATPTLRRLARAPERLAETFAYSVRLTLSISSPLALGTFWFAPTLLALTKDGAFVSATSATRWPRHALAASGWSRSS